MQKLSQEDKAKYEWQMWVPEFGKEGQEKLKNASVMISRAGGLGGVVALELAAAGIGSMVIAHGGNVKHSDLNRQLLMTHASLGSPRSDSIKRQLLALRPDLNLVVVPENVNDANVSSLVEQVDIVVDCAPLFSERMAMNFECVRQNKPLVECAMYELEAQITTMIPHKTPCLSCLYPENPNAWQREFPVFGAVSGTIGCLAAMEVIKLIAGFGELLTNQLLLCDLRDMSFDKVSVSKNVHCQVCSS